MDEGPSVFEDEEQVVIQACEWLLETGKGEQMDFPLELPEKNTVLAMP